MFRPKSLIACLIAIVLCSVASADTKSAKSPQLTAEQIVQKNVDARGGLKAWRAVNTLSMSGQMEAGGNHVPVMPEPGAKGAARMPRFKTVDQVKLPFTMELKRQRKERVELQFAGKTAIQVYDGTNGWKIRPYLNRNEVESYTPAEIKTASLQTDLDGPLVDYAAKGTRIELVGTEKVENNDAYKLKLTMSNGNQIHIWIDANTFLETKIEGVPRELDGKYHPVEVYYRDYRTVNGLKFPFVLETKVLGAEKVPGKKELQSLSEKIFIEKVEVNPKLDDARFTKPTLEQAGITMKPMTSASTKPMQR